nr:MAG TPA: hypothetical protein [Caudoviricetes sp.]
MFYTYTLQSVHCRFFPLFVLLFYRYSLRR